MRYLTEEEIDQLIDEGDVDGLEYGILYEDGESEDCLTLDEVVMKHEDNAGSEIYSYE